MLRVENLNAYYGEAQVLWDININVKENEIVAIIGSNGAGKSSLLRTLSGIGPKAEYTAFIKDVEISTLSPRKRLELGLAHVPEGRRLYDGLSVNDNILMGSYLRRDKKLIKEDIKRMYSLFPRLGERKNQLAGKLSGGEQQMCAIARGLMSRPKILLIDELSLGLAPVFIDDLFKIIKIIREEGTTIVLVEQDVQNGLELADRGYVIEHGKVAMEGTSSELLNNENIKKLYLGL